MHPTRSARTLVARWLQSPASGLVLALAVFGVAAAWLVESRAGEAAVRIPPPAFQGAQPAAAGPQVAVFAGGCFWGVQAVFQHTAGVLQAVSGYAGGAASTAKYDLVTTGMTGHAESVQVTYDPAKVSYAKLLQIFFSVIHDPTQRNRQGPDTGTHYRSALFTVGPMQQQVAERYVAQLDAAKVYPKRIVTEVAPLQGFHPAEAYHQDYATLHPMQPYIVQFDLPKIANLKTMFPDVYRDKPVLVGARAQALVRSSGR